MDAQPYDSFLGESEAGTESPEGAQTPQEVLCLSCTALPCCVHQVQQSCTRSSARLLFALGSSCLLCAQHQPRPEFSQKFIKALASTVPEQLDNSLLPNALQLDSIILVP